MTLLKEFFNYLSNAIDVIGVFILVFGFAKSLLKYAIAEFSGNPLKISVKRLQSIRCDIGIYILLALDFLIASDIIHTVMEITQEQLVELAIMIILRTGIGFFLGKEIEEIEHTEKQL